VKKVTQLLATSALSFGLALPAAAEWATGEIRRLDPQNQRMTIKHGEIKSLDMPPMTMVFQVKDPALLEGLKAQDQIDFQAQVEGTKNVVTAIRKRP
jgi:Cu(I)/Ag(I) efflux system periplasmic protein CusF